MTTRRVLALFSGGLDSLIAVFWMKKLGFEVIPFFFQTPFFSAKKAIKVANENNLELNVIDFTEAHLKMLVNPRYGYGKNFNPCIDCHGLMYRTLKDYLVEYEADFIISGEVLNQRPMSQRFDSLNAVRKLSEISDLIIRPLSQKRLPDTKPITEGWVKKEDLLDIVGRSRKEQMQIAEEFNLKGFSNAGGGCLLTDNGYSRRLKDLIDYDQLSLQNILFLEIGRHFRINDTTKLVITRHNDEMKYFHSIVQNEMIIKCLNVPGPIGIICFRDKITEESLEIAGGIILRYCPKSENNETINYGKQFNLINSIECLKYNDHQIEKYRI